MVTSTKIVFFVCILLAALTRTCVKESDNNYTKTAEIPSETKLRQVNADKNTFEENSEITRCVLITHCGSCHQSTLDSHKKGAIEIFDLDMKEKWHTSLSKEHLPGIANRTQNKPSITTEQKEALDIFLTLKELQFEQ